MNSANRALMEIPTVTSMYSEAEALPLKGDDEGNAAAWSPEQLFLRSEFGHVPD
jgi:hypothetical protein